MHIYTNMSVFIHIYVVTYIISASEYFVVLLIESLSLITN